MRCTHIHTVTRVHTVLCTVHHPYYRKQTLAQSEGEALQTQAAVEAKRAGEVTHALMEVTVEREQARKAKEDRERKEAAESRLKAMLELKQSIAASKASL